MKQLLMAFALALLPFQSNAQVSEIKIEACPKNSALLFVEISGASAMQIYVYTAKRLGVSLSELGYGAITNDMNCLVKTVNKAGEATAVVCSFVMNGKKNVPYPQLDPGFAREEVIECQ